MEQLYTKSNNTCELVKTSTSRIKFLLDYSNSLNIIEHKGISFENNLN